MAKRIRYYNNGTPDQLIGPVDFAGFTVIINPKGAKYERKQVKKEKEYKDEKSGLIEVRSYLTTTVVKVSDENEDNFADLPPGFDTEVMKGRYSGKVCPDGTPWSAILTTKEQDLEAREAAIAEMEKKLQLKMAAGLTDIELLEAKKQQLLDELAALESNRG